MCLFEVGVDPMLANYLDDGAIEVDDADESVTRAFWQAMGLCAFTADCHHACWKCFMGYRYLRGAAMDEAIDRCEAWRPNVEDCGIVRARRPSSTGDSGR